MPRQLEMTFERMRKTAGAVLVSFVCLSGLAVILTTPLPALAEIQKRSITLEWEEIPESTGYEIEVTRIMKDGAKKKPAIFKTKKPTWTGKIYPGKYQMRLRSHDSRHVAGDWAEPSEFWVKLPSPDPVKPKNGETINTGVDEKADVKLAWKSVEGAAGYRVEILDKEDRTVESHDSQEPSLTVSLPVAKVYKWRVVSLMQEDAAVGEGAKAVNGFTLVGKKLNVPVVEKPDTKFVREVNWSRPERSETFAYALMRKGKGGKWQVVERKAMVKENKIKIDPNSPGGEFRLQVKALADMRESSETTQTEFYVYEGSRTPAAIEQAMLREAIEKEYNSYWIGSYLLTFLDYSGFNREMGRGVKYSVLAGTGRLGYGYMPKSQWGFVGFADMGGAIIKNENHLFASAEGDAVWRTYIWGTTQFRALGGMFAKQLPEARGQTEGAIEVTNVSFAGPTAGVQLWHPFTYKLGIQVNAQMYVSALGLKTPNGEAISPTLSYQAGLMGSYKMKENVTGFAGYAYRVDSVAYKAKPWDGSASSSSFAKSGDVNEVTMTGHYLNLYLEWGF